MLHFHTYSTQSLKNTLKVRVFMSIYIYIEFFIVNNFIVKYKRERKVCYTILYLIIKFLPYKTTIFSQSLLNIL